MDLSLEDGDIGNRHLNQVPFHTVQLIVLKAVLFLFKVRGRHIDRYCSTLQTRKPRLNDKCFTDARRQLIVA